MSNILFLSCLLLLIFISSISAADAHSQDASQETLSKWNHIRAFGSDNHRRKRRDVISGSDTVTLTLSTAANGVTSLVNLPDAAQLQNVAKVLGTLFQSYSTFCYRRSYSRGAGHVFGSCPSGTSEKIGLICYPLCDSKYKGDGPVCWSTCPTATQPVTCGVGCTKTSLDCAESVVLMVESVVAVSSTILTFGIDAPFVDIITDILSSAARRDWVNIAKVIGQTAFKFSKAIFPTLVKTYPTWDQTTLQTTSQNAALLMVITAMNDNIVLKVLLTYFNIDGVINAYNHGSCSFVDGSN